MRSATITSLGCPECGARLTTLHIGEEAVGCPECQAVMFAWRKPGEELTRADLEARRTSHYREYIRLAQRWLRVEHRLGAGVLVSMAFAAIAQTLPE